jgi:nitrate reductase NapAB chaperone NapD
MKTAGKIIVVLCFERTEMLNSVAKFHYLTNVIELVD